MKAFEDRVYSPSPVGDVSVSSGASGGWIVRARIAVAGAILVAVATTSIGSHAAGMLGKAPVDQGRTAIATPEQSAAVTAARAVAVARAPKRTLPRVEKFPQPTFYRPVSRSHAAVSETTATGEMTVAAATPIDYLFVLTRRDGSQDIRIAQLGIPERIDGDGDGVADAILHVVAAVVPDDAGRIGPGFTTANMRVTTLNPNQRLLQNPAYGLEVFFADGSEWYHLGFDGRWSGVPTIFDATLQVVSKVVTLTVKTKEPGPSLLLTGGVNTGTWFTPAARESTAVTALVQPVPETITIDLRSSSANVVIGGTARLEANVTSITEAPTLCDPSTAKKTETIEVDIPSMTGGVTAGWTNDCAVGRKVNTVSIQPTSLIGHVAFAYRNSETNAASGTRIISDAVGSVTGLPAGETTVEILEQESTSRIALRAPSPVDVEVGFGIQRTAYLMDPSWIGSATDNYVFVQDFGNSKGVGARFKGLTTASVQIDPSQAGSAESDDKVLNLDISAASRQLVLYTSKGSKYTSGTMTLPDRMKATIDAGEVRFSVHPESSFDVTAIAMNMRADNGAKFFGPVTGISAIVSNLSPGTTFVGSSTKDEISLSLTAGSVINSLDIGMSDNNGRDYLPPGVDGVLLHDNGGFSAHVRLSKMTSMSASKSTYGCGGTCSSISAGIHRTQRHHLVVDIQTIVIYRLGNVDYPIVESAYISQSNSPKDLALVMTMKTKRVTFAGVSSDVFAGMTLLYDAGESSGLTRVTKDDGIGGRTHLSIASLPATILPGHALEMCVYKDNSCDHPYDVPTAKMSAYVKASAPILIHSLEVCSNAECGDGILARALEGRYLDVTYEQIEGSIYDDRYFYVGTNGYAVKGWLWMNEPGDPKWLDAYLDSVWTAGRQIHLAGFVPVSSSTYGTMSCGGALTSVKLYSTDVTGPVCYFAA